MEKLLHKEHWRFVRMFVKCFPLQHPMSFKTEKRMVTKALVCPWSESGYAAAWISKQKVCSSVSLEISSIKATLLTTQVPIKKGKNLNNLLWTTEHKILNGIWNLSLVYTIMGCRSKLCNFSYMTNIAKVNTRRSTCHHFHSVKSTADALPLVFVLVEYRSQQ